MNFYHASEQSFIVKQNRKLIAAACLFLASKINEPKVADGDSKLTRIMGSLERHLDVEARDVYAVEFITYAELEFSLFLPKSEVLHHLQRI